MSTDTTQWRVGACTITSVVEDEIAHIPPEFFFPEATAPEVAAEDWLGPDQIDDDGSIALRVQALVVDQPGRRLLIDPCVGNGKHLPLPFWNEQQWPFMERFADAGFTPESIDTVVHTHLHSDHVGWDTTPWATPGCRPSRTPVTSTPSASWTRVERRRTPASRGPTSSRSPR